MWNDHITDNCKKDPSYIICSLCSSNDHNHRSCESETKQCINCSGSHSTLSFSCPHRKEIAKNVGAKSDISSLLKCSKATAATPTPRSITTSILNNSALSNSHDSILRAGMCMVMAALKQHKSPIEFQLTLDKLLSANNLPCFSMGDVLPPDLGPLNKIANETCSIPSPFINSSNVAVENPKSVDGDSSNVNVSSCVSDANNVPEEYEVHHGSSGLHHKSSVLCRESEGKSLNSESPVAAAVSRFSKMENSKLPNSSRQLRNTYSRKKCSS